jgi:hypothetical protein
MMTRAEQLRRALKVLAPAQCKGDIEAALDAIEWDGVEPKPNSGEVRKAVKRLLKQLEDCKRAYEALQKLDHAHAHELMTPLDLSEHIALYEEWLSEPAGKPRRSAAKQEAAVKEARVLVLKYCKRKQDHSPTRKNAWHRLSRILAGDGRDHYNLMLKFKT